MGYLTCPSCGLTLHAAASFLVLDSCPRCIAHRRTAVPMLLSEARPVFAERAGGARSNSAKRLAADTRGDSSVACAPLSPSSAAGESHAVAGHT
jgi:hypothetical protein